MPHTQDDGPVEAPTRTEASDRTNDDPAFDLFRAIIPETATSEYQERTTTRTIISENVVSKAVNSSKKTEPEINTDRHYNPKTGLKVDRLFTTPGLHPFETVTWDKRTSRISNEKGKIIFEMVDVEVPSDWSQLATDIVVSKYFRKAGVPQIDADGTPQLNSDGTPVLGPERSVKQTANRLAGAWRHWGEHYGYFAR
ncbi:MAG: hypothetical protein AAB647_01105, partial [Patescibacteria group bacterium]